MTNAIRVTTPTTSVEVQGMTAGESRAVILATWADMRAGRISAAEAVANTLMLKALHDSIITELNVHKRSVAFEGTAHEFSKVTKMGQTKLLG
jgi:hypothetical protein